ncbi:MAG: translation initiation factor IF-2 [Clostridiales bacterium]|nr:translation initiation factor IF-2 [Clostridiales bacterium]
MGLGDKYRIHEFAKDFKLTSKAVINILSEHGEAPKNHMQILTDTELNYLFEYFTQKNQTSNIERALKSQKAAAEAANAEAKEKAEAEAKIKAEAKAKAEVKTKAEAVAKAKAEAIAKPTEEAAKAETKSKVETKTEPKPKPETKTAAKTEQHTRSQTRPVRGSDHYAPPRFKQPQKQEQKKPVKKPERREDIRTRIPQSKDDAPAITVSAEPAKAAQKGTYVDTRGTSVNLARYDERIYSLVPEKAEFTHGATKQKLTKRNTDKKPQQFSGKKRQEEQDKLKKIQQEVMKKQQLKVMIPDEIAVGELATRLKKTAAEVIKQLMKLGVLASVSQFIDFDTASLVAMELGAKVEHEVIVTIEDKLIDTTEDKEENLVTRDPVVVVMGHVDHGKTSLLDSIRRTNVAAGEAGGITQHIGAYRVKLGDREITFIDTPGHAAFTSMRARGASVTDIVILVVAADDGIMPQTVEAINHAKAADVPIVVAVNKIDKENAQPDRVLQQMTEYGLVPEDWGGDTVVCKISALKGEGIENLLEMVLLTADMLELKANPERSARGTVIEAKLDRGRGPVATVLVQNGTLNSGDVIIAGTSVGRIRVMNDDTGQRIETAGPSVPVEIVGLSEVPNAGDLFYSVDDERMARELVEQRKEEEKAEQARSVARVSLDSLFDYIKEGEVKDLNLIVKADVHGTSEAVKISLEKLSNDEVRVKVIHSGVGAISESDVMLADASNAIIIGFNVRPSSDASEIAAHQNVDIRLYRVIYDCLEEIEAAMKGMLAPKFRESVIGHVEVRQIFKASGLGTIAGCYVKTGKVTRSSKIRLVRDGIVVHEGEIASLKRFKDDAREVLAGYECGITIERYNDIKEGDEIEAYVMEEVER